ncbi:MAG: septum formation inhibitor Maf [Akkermansiaceae bacterium]
MKFLLLTLAMAPLHADQVRDFWFSGAEINSYELSQSRYGQNHRGHAEFIFVTEPFLTEKQVKDERGSKNSTQILKLNALTTFNTGFYSYRTMTSTFRPIDLENFPHALKSTTSIQDWCGQAFQQLNRRENGWSVQLNSYFEKFADKNTTLPSAYLEDELWITLRLDPKKLPTGKIDMIPGALFTRFHHKPIVPKNAIATLDMSGKVGVYTVSYPSYRRALSIGFSKKFPHIIGAWTEKTTSGTTTAKLSHRMMNVNYWDLNKPKHSTKRKELGLDPIAN